MAIKINGLQSLIDELDASTSMEMSELVLSKLNKVIASHSGQIIQCHDDVVLCTFKKSRACVQPGRIACQAAIEIAKEEIFLVDVCQLLENVNFTIVIHSGDVSFLSHEGTAGSGVFTFGRTITETMEIMSCCPKSRLYVTEPILEEYSSCLSFKGELQHNLLSVNDMIVAELTGVQPLESGSHEESVNWNHLTAKLA